MAITHGVEAEKQATSVSTPIVAASGIIFAVGTAPVQATDGKANEIILANSYEEAVKAFGYSDDWEKYGLCEVIYSTFQLYGVSPLIMVNVLNPLMHYKAVAAATLDIVDSQIKLPYDAISSTIVVTGKTLGTDYEVFYDDKNCIIEFLAAVEGNSAEVSYREVDPTMVTADDIIGGYSATTHKTTGLELIDGIFPKYQKIPDLILCPNWSHDATVAAVMSAKGENINGLFEAMAVLDVDTTSGTGVVYYSDVPTWKRSQNFMKTNELVCFPKVKLGDRIFNYASQLAGLIADVDNTEELGSGTPCESASNKSLQADSTVLADGTELLMDIQQANSLNDNGIITAVNLYNGFVSWGNYTACYPANTDPVDYFYCVSRMFKWVAKTVILSNWKYVDRRMMRRLLDAVLQGVNDWLNGLTSEEVILGGRVELQANENTDTALMSGNAKFHIYLTPPVPLQKLDFLLEYDLSYLRASLLPAA
jgi:phage tail sheath protein FI